MSNSLPSRPNLDHLRDQAKSLLSNYRKGDPGAIDRFRELLPDRDPSLVALHDAQFVVAREYGFPSWPKLVAHVEELLASRDGITPEVEADYVNAAMWYSPSRVRRLLELHPGLTRFSPACALVSAEPDLIQGLDANAPLGPQNLPPIFYVGYSRIHQVLPERYAAQEECARILLDEGAKTNEVALLSDGQSRMPVLFGAAAMSGHLGVARLLLEHGANPNDGESVYHSAESGRIEMLELLKEFGADFGSSEEPLGFLCYYREFDGNAADMLRGARWLLEHGANPNIRRTEKLVTPLINACRYRGEELIELLLDQGADPTLMDSDGNTAYQIASQYFNWSAIRLLQANGIEEKPTEEGTFFCACSANTPEVIQLMLSRNPELPQRYHAKGLDLLRQYAETSQMDGILGLLAAGFPVDGDGGVTPLHAACLQGQVESVKLLIERGAQIDLKDNQHDGSPLAWACWGSIYHRNPTGDHAEVCRILLAAGSSSEDALEQLGYPDRPEEVRSAIQEALAAR